MRVLKSSITKKAVRSVKKITRSTAMVMYRKQLSRFHKNKAGNNIIITQRNVVIGTDDTWFNAQEIDRNPAWVQVPDASYVWSSRDLGAEVAVVSKQFTLSSRRRVRNASLLLSVDNYAIVLINGRFVVYDTPQATVSFFNPGRTFDVRRFLRRGQNDIVIIAFNFGGRRTIDNPAGVAARLSIRQS
ncbi:hypothetical protein [Paenibacillus glacialis]|uniref:Glycosyl hydrolases family 2 sugar binding domain-containing protein n=1 Tax=Paenibacillus glacialis TaxID=494026 RepID=A0A168KRP9_9BACL|nr:hypothetical protein [Paenibacillus glacialis]OAB42377.1 hypothetical protein PGLA_11920 [Paenibacillus glacialis]